MHSGRGGGSIISSSSNSTGGIVVIVVVAKRSAVSNVEGVGVEQVVVVVLHRVVHGCFR